MARPPARTLASASDPGVHRRARREAATSRVKERDAALHTEAPRIVALFESI